MKLTTSSFRNGGPIPERYALATPDPNTNVTLADNVNPELRWDEVPEGTRSFALICHDPDVPSRGDDVNQEDREVPTDLPRVDFFHWVAVDFPPELRSIGEGEFCVGVTPEGGWRLWPPWLPPGCNNWLVCRRPASRAVRRWRRPFPDSRDPCAIWRRWRLPRWRSRCCCCSAPLGS